MNTIKVDALDQASGLRRLFATRGAQIVALTSAAVVNGRAQMIANAAATLAARGRRVLLLDENPAPRNALAEVSETARSAGDLLQVIRGEASLAQATVQVNRNLATLGAVRLANAELPMTKRLADLMHEVEDSYDFVLVDCSASRTSQISTLGLHAHYLVIAVTAESNGIMQAYAQIKRLAQIHQREHFQILVTGKANRDDARNIFNNLRQVAHEHLGVRLSYLGLVNTGKNEMLADLIDTGFPLHPQAMGAMSGLAATLERLGGVSTRNSVV